MQRITAYLFSTVLRSSSNLQKICSQTAFPTYLDDISVQREATANLRADLSLSGETHSFGRTAVQSHPHVSSDVFEGHFDPKPPDSEAGPVPALEAWTSRSSATVITRAQRLLCSPALKPGAFANTSAVYPSPKYHP